MSESTVRLRDHGPLVIDGPVKILDAEGNELTQAQGKPAVALCRCGHSQNKPFCDGAHKAAGFQSAIRANG
ncbi:MAG: CDGSH iron-sulfur domain-containing protein [Pirellulales bacterium]